MTGLQTQEYPAQRPAKAQTLPQATHSDAGDSPKATSGTPIHYAITPCSLGLVLIALTSKGLCAIQLGDDEDRLRQDLQSRFPQAALTRADASFDATINKVLTFIEAPQTGLDLPLDTNGTAFQERVWTELNAIPYGKTVSYTEIATRIGKPKAVRAVAQACGANRIAIAIPCHRVVRHDGALSGYRWGIDRKRILLARETL